MDFGSFNEYLHPGSVITTCRTQNSVDSHPRMFDVRVFVAWMIHILHLFLHVVLQDIFGCVLSFYTCLHVQTLRLNKLYY